MKQSPDWAVRRWIVAFTLVMLVVTQPALAQYTIVDLGVGVDRVENVSYNASYGIGNINNAGQSAGYTGWQGWWARDNAVRWDQFGNLLQLPPLAPPPRQEYWCYGLDINALGVVAGGGTNPATSGDDACYWDAEGNLHIIGSLHSEIWGHGAYGEGINDLGTVVGFSDTFGGGDRKAFKWTAETGIVDLGRPEGYAQSGLSDISNNGVAFGYAITFDGTWHAFRYDPNLGWQDLGTPDGYTNSDSVRVNNHNEFAGYAWNTDGPYRAFKWSNGVWTDLGTLGTDSLALGINDAGVVVGWSTTETGDRHAFIWNQEHGIRDLNDLLPGDTDWVLYEAWGINDQGWIVGSGRSPAGEDHAFLLKLAPPERRVTVNLPDYSASDACVGPVDVNYTICRSDGSSATGSFQIPAGQSSGSTTYVPNPLDTTICVKAGHWVSKKTAIPSGTDPYSVDAGANGDINGDDFVDPSDFDLYLAAEFSFCGQSNYNPLADLNGDGFVDPLDFAIYQANEFAFGDGCACP